MRTKVKLLDSTLVLYPIGFLEHVSVDEVIRFPVEREQIHVPL